MPPITRIEAVKAAVWVIRCNPKNAEAYYKLGLLFEHQSRDEEAQKAFEMARSYGYKA
jgi:Flp pilus assembly protein TadD